MVNSLLVKRFCLILSKPCPCLCSASHCPAPSLAWASLVYHGSIALKLHSFFTSAIWHAEVKDPHTKLESTHYSQDKHKLLWELTCNYLLFSSTDSKYALFNIWDYFVLTLEWLFLMDMGILFMDTILKFKVETNILNAIQCNVQILTYSTSFYTSNVFEGGF